MHVVWLHGHDPLDAWKDALACDPVSAFGGVIVTNSHVDEDDSSRD